MSEEDRIAKARAKRVRRAYRQGLLALGLAMPQQDVERVVSDLADVWTGSEPPEAPEVERALAPFIAKRDERALRELVATEMAAVVKAEGLAVPSPLPAPSLHIASRWRDGNRAPGLTWLRDLHGRTVRRAMDAHTGIAALAERLTAGDKTVLPDLQRATKDFRGPLHASARSLFTAFEATREAAPELERAVVAVIDAIKAENGVRRRSEAGIAPVMVGSAEAARRLSATPTEFRRWVRTGRIPVAARMPLKRGSGTVLTAKFDGAVLKGLALRPPFWRAMDEADRAPRHRQRPDLRARLRRKAANMAGVATTTEGLRLDGIVVRPVDPAWSFAEVRLLVETPWPDDVAVTTRLGEPVAPRTMASVARKVRLHVETEALRIRHEVDAMVKAATMIARQAAHVIPEEDRARFRERLDACIDHERLGREIAPVDDALRAALLRAFSAAVASFAGELTTSLLRERSGLADYPAMFPVARAMNRELFLFVGPTNSGKTHRAVAALSEAKDGTYLAPLRLMALETHDRLNEGSVPTSMATGEERIDVPGARHLSCTVEMADVETPIEVAVIDEIQMVDDRQRGWAWAQAAVGIPAKTVFMTGSVDAIPTVSRIAALTGEPLRIVHHERKTPLVPLDDAVDEILPGDAVIAFSRSEVMRLRQSLRGDRSVATIYGALSPEVRRAEAKRFRSGEAEVLVATDAIAMGLNLPIKRVLFSTLSKFDGERTRRLTHSEIRQIAGRAGRHGFGDVGYAGVLSPSAGGTEINGSSVRIALTTDAVPPRDGRLPVMPPWRAVEAVSASLATEDLPRILKHVSGRLLAGDPILRPADMEKEIAVAYAVEASGLPLRQRHGYVGCPVDVNSPASMRDIREGARRHGLGVPVPHPKASSTEIPDTDESLLRCEEVSKRLSCYLWLARRWPETYVDKAGAMRERSRVNALIEGALAKRSLNRHCRSCGRKIPLVDRGVYCGACEGTGGVRFAAAG